MNQKEFQELQKAVQPFVQLKDCNSWLESGWDFLGDPGGWNPWNLGNLQLHSQHPWTKLSVPSSTFPQGSGQTYWPVCHLLTCVSALPDPEKCKAGCWWQAGIPGPRGSAWVEFSEWDQTKVARYQGSYHRRALTLEEPSENFHFHLLPL